MPIVPWDTAMHYLRHFANVISLIMLSHDLLILIFNLPDNEEDGRMKIDKSEEYTWNDFAEDHPG